MNREEATAFIQHLLTRVVDPVDLLGLVTLKVTIDNLSADEWTRAAAKAEKILSQ